MSARPNPRKLRSVWVARVSLVLLSLPLAGASQGDADRVEVLTTAAQGLISDTAGGESALDPAGALSLDGRYIAFTSFAANLPPGNAAPGVPKLQVFLHDRITGTTLLVSHRAGAPNTPGNGSSEMPAISGNGRYVAYQSAATDLVAGQSDANGLFDVFLFDRITGTTTLVSHAAGSPLSTGNQESQARPAISADGRFLAFLSEATDLVAGQTEQSSVSDVFLFDRATGTVELVSRKAGSLATTANGASVAPVLSADGAWIAFASTASDLVTSQVENGSFDIFLFERATGATLLVSHASSSPTTAGNGASLLSALSGDGRYVAFQSTASDLVAGALDSNQGNDIFLFDRVTSTTLLVSHSSSSPASAANGHSAHPSISADGARVVYESEATDLVAGQTAGTAAENVFLFDRDSAGTTLVSRRDGAVTEAANGASRTAQINANGDFVVFHSSATDLTSGETDGNGLTDIFLYDLVADAVTLVSRSGRAPDHTANGESMLPALSGDGRVIAFISQANDLLADRLDANGTGDIFLFDRASGDIAAATLRDPAFPSLTAGGASDTAASLANEPSSTCAQGIVSANGRWVVSSSFASNLVSGQEDTNFAPDVFLHDRENGSAVLVSRSVSSVTKAGNGAAERAMISADGRFVVYTSQATDLVPGQDGNEDFDVFLYDRQTGANTLVSRSASSPSVTGNGGSFSPCLSRNGRFVLFASVASDLVAGVEDDNDNLDLFLYDRQAGTLTLVSRDAGTGAAAGTDSFFAISSDGRFIAFASFADHVVPGQIDLDSNSDVFLYDRTQGSTVLVSRTPQSPVTAAGGIEPAISADGRFVAFSSDNPGLVNGVADDNEDTDVFLFDRRSNLITLVSRSADSPLSTADGGSGSPVIDEEGRRVAFISRAGNLVEGQSDSNGSELDVFLFDRHASTTLLVSRSAAAATETGNADSLHPVLSGNGHHVAFLSRASDLVSGQVDESFGFDVFLFDTIEGTTTLASRASASPDTAANAESSGPALSENGRSLVFTSLGTDLIPGDFNGQPDVFVFRPLPGRGEP